MTLHVPKESGAAVADGALAQRDRLRAALALVESMAGGRARRAKVADTAPPPDAYARARPIARRRFDAVAGEAGAFAAAGIAALIRHRDATGRDCAAAAEQLSRDMRAALAALDRILADE